MYKYLIAAFAVFAMMFATADEAKAQRFQLRIGVGNGYNPYYHSPSIHVYPQRRSYLHVVPDYNYRYPSYYHSPSIHVYSQRRSYLHVVPNYNYRYPSYNPYNRNHR